MKTTACVRATAAFFALFIVGACSNINTASTAAQVDGLALVPDTQFKEYYRKSGSDLSRFSQIGLESCAVSFRKHWQRDQNSHRSDLASRVTEKDIDRIKNRMSDSCNDKFRESLAQSTAYTLVDNFSSGDAVLVLRPSIVDLNINAPDVRGAGFTRSFTTSAGEMTLSLDLIDGGTGETLARVVDRRRDSETIYLEPTNSVTNQADFNRSLRRWAKLLRSGLDEATL